MPAGAETFSEALRVGAEVFHHLKAVLTSVASPPASATRADSLPTSARRRSRRSSNGGAGGAPGPGRDRARSRGERGLPRRPLQLPGEGKSLDPAEMIGFYGSLADRFPLVSIEDGLDEDAWADWKAMTGELGDRLQLVGDDLFVTNVEFLRRGIAEGVANAILVKVNQIGTLTETLDVVALAREAGYATVMSHRSGETEDPRSRISQSRAPARSRPARPRGRTALRSTTSSCASRRSSG